MKLYEKISSKEYLKDIPRYGNPLMMYPKPTKSKRKKRSKLPTFKSLVLKLDKVFSQYIRLRDGKSVLSGKTEGLTCSHLIRRGKKSTRWSETNCHAMTVGENYNHNYYPEPYTAWFIQKYGFQAYVDLKKESEVLFKPSREWLADQILNYTILVDELGSDPHDNRSEYSQNNKVK